ncbi:RNA polymerase sigma factor [Hespellia stercorisuis]|uniref:RNA polymerase sigma-70 factor, ECF subfamily n=1 Tax=Hespellia stercorisuis DSM 15480 TaxID=1121950 RepID=A0A1M6JEH1_9FIRM|nr:sigma-70 family RNA polymerase sigma factor [Hespellia stercorisuis]SHJ45146.1 RNA polymerase sigma-70 factor, ECF subfamily [Hespellia stercorisuis DSM 15480]
MTGNQEFDELYYKYRNLVLNVAFDYLHDRDLANDIAQNTFLQLFIFYDKMEHNNIKSWLYTTAKHFALNYQKKYSREVVELDETIAEKSLMYPDVEIIVQEKETELARENLHTEIFVNMLNKNERWYEAMSLVYLAKVPQAKVAEEMEISLESLQSMLHRARSWIQKNYSIEYEETRRE